MPSVTRPGSGHGAFKRRSLILLAGLSSLAVAACGSASTQAGSNSSSKTPAAGSSSVGSGSGGVAAASATLAKYESTVTPAAPGPAFDASKAAGKLVWLVEQEHSNPAIAIVAQNIQTALTHEHVKVLSCDAGGVSVQITSCINQGISHQAAAIITDGGSPSAYTAGVKAANAAHVPLISALDVPLPTASDSSGVLPLLQGLTANAGPPDPLSGQLAADFIVKDSKANAHILFIGSPGIVGSTYEQQMFTSTLSKDCPKCTVDVQQVSIPNWASDLGPLVTSQMNTHPDINYVVPVFDPMAAYTDPAIQQAGKSGTVKVVTVNGSLAQMQDLAHGQLIVCDVGQNLPEMGFLAADETLRALSGVTEVKEEATVVRVFTSANIHSVTLTPAAYDSGAWYYGATSALSSTFYKLWSSAS